MSIGRIWTGRITAIGRMSTGKCQLVESGLVELRLVNVDDWKNGDW